MFADLALARRLELGEAQIAVEFAEAYAANHTEPVAMCIAIGGGQAAFAGAASPLTQAIGLGMNGPVSAADLDQLEDFYFSREASVHVHLCPLADVSLTDLLCQRGYRISEYNSVLFRPLETGLEHSNAFVRRAELHEADLWARTVLEGFFEREDLTGQEVELGALLFHIRSGSSWWAFNDEKPVSAGGMAIRDKLAILSGDSTLIPYRRHGLHRAVILARLAYAASEGCDLAAATTLPGSVSQINYERLGFRVAYTKMVMQRD